MNFASIFKQYCETIVIDMLLNKVSLELQLEKDTIELFDMYV